MATDNSGRFSSHMRGVVVTSFACSMGLVAAVASSVVTAGLDAPATSSQALYVLVGAVLVQFPVLSVIGIDMDEFSAKDYLYVAFMTFALWFISWGILLTTGSTF
ncbi:hypothetical protein BRD20_04015 [Halobacteriales archaeon SW_8_65_20]|nr:MAG: hypothetical protein BRC71_00825 [Halobacteriales archaeon QH_7_65_31]PSQ30748.1 MAG: hypothetical protein BRD16_05845 [Halobacteriales archaeon SW_6_65_46]PSQ53349.1 MAG: hypothetical protein BRD20_04015 [Halobacteriales archaeon SW_8_65_20]